MSRRRGGRRPATTRTTSRSECVVLPGTPNRGGLGLPAFLTALSETTAVHGLYRIGEWERVGGVDGYSTIRAYLQPGLYETQAYARKKAARLADEDYESGGDGGFQVVAVGESPFDERRPSLSGWWAAHPYVFDFDDFPF
jgi:hypothetical protein